MRQHLFILLLISVALLINGCSSPITPTSTNPLSSTPSSTGTKMTVPVTVIGEGDLPPTAKAELNDLNNWITDAMDLASCPTEYSQQYSQQHGQQANIIPSGEANGWINIHEERLVKLGYEIRWNCEIGKFETVQAGQKPANICSCQRTFTTATSP